MQAELEQGQSIFVDACCATPLTLQAPGREFGAVCAPFRLDVPDFIF